VLEKFTILFVGWLLGLIGPAVVDSIRRKRENDLGRKAIRSELNELATTLALAAYTLRMDQRRVDRPFLEWLKNDLERHAPAGELQEMIPRLRTLLSMSAEDLQAVNAHVGLKPSKATLLQRCSAPLLESRVSALWSFDTAFQRALLDLKHEFSLLDDLVDRSRKYFDLTFTKLEGGNYALVQENLEQASAEYRRRAERVVDKIRKLNGDAQ
jgi:hypothetical protein